MTSGIQTCPLCVPHLASSDLHLLLLLSLASNPKHSHSAVHPPRPAGWKTGLNVLKPTPHCFNNTPLVNRECKPSVFLSLSLLCVSSPFLLPQTSVKLLCECRR